MVVYTQPASHDTPIQQGKWLPHMGYMPLKQHHEIREQPLEIVSAENSSRVNYQFSTSTCSCCCCRGFLVWLATYQTSCAFRAVELRTQREFRFWNTEFKPLQLRSHLAADNYEKGALGSAVLASACTPIQRPFVGLPAQAKKGS